MTGLLLVGLAGLPGISAATPGDEPWDAPAFSVDPRTLLDASAKHPANENDGALILIREALFTFDEDGRSESRWHTIFRVDSPSLTRELSMVQVVWSPWYQESPVVRARVITRDGREHRLDPDTLGEYSASEAGPDLYGDLKSLKGPLPAVDVGSLIEQKYVLRDSQPRFEAGTVEHFIVGMPFPTLKTRLIIDAPSTLPLDYVVRLLPGLEPTRDERDGRVRLVFEVDQRRPWQMRETWAPNDIARFPYIAFSTGASWGAVARRYSEIVEERIKNADLKKLVKKATGNSDSRETTITDLLDGVLREVRYTGVEFGSRAIVPASPKTTLERQFGDCKDKSVLLVALLREAGIEARVALLAPGPGADLDPELPGIGAFSHAIVFVGGENPIWIDPSLRFARIDELPIHDQGRLALVASPSSTGLIRTPTADAGSNRVLETREVFLASKGGARIVETTEWHGHFDHNNRETFGSAASDEIKQHLEAYAKSTYAAKKLVNFEITDLDDLAGPMRLELELTGAGLAWTAVPEAVVIVPLSALMSNLPHELQPTGPTSDGDQGEDAATADQDFDRPSSEHAVILPVPYVTEWRYRIHPPPGYAIRDVPQGGVRSFGPATLTQEHSVGDDGTVLSVFRFESGARFSPDEARALTRDLAELYEEEPFRIVFHHVGETHLAEGRIAEAFAEFQLLADEFPEDASARSGVARALLAAGFGEQARAEARAAVELQPESAAAHTTLGIVLGHDILGRKFHRGFDLEGCESAFRRATELDPEDVEARGELAILLEHDALGNRYSSDARLVDAVSVYRTIRSDLEVTYFDDNLLLALAYLGEFDEIKKLARDSEGAEFADIMRIMAVAATKDAESATKEASRLSTSGESYRSKLIAASEMLTLSRRYSAAAALLTEGSKGDPQALAFLSRADLLRRTRPYEELGASSNKPDELIRKILITLFVGTDPVSEIQQLLAKPLREEAAGEPPVGNVREIMLRLRSAALADVGSMATLLDLMFSNMRISTEGSDAVGHRAKVQFLLPGAETGAENVYIVKEGSDYRFVVMGGPLSFLGVMVLEWVAEERLDAAKQWLDWAYQDIRDAGGSGDPLAEHPLRRFWTPGRDGAPGTMRYAAACLIADSPMAEKAVPILEKGRAEADPERRPDFDRVLLRTTAWTRDSALMSEVARRLVAAYPSSEIAFSALIEGLVRTDQRDEARRLIDERRAEQPGDELVRRLELELAVFDGDVEEQGRLLNEFVAEGKGTPFDYNNLAWHQIVVEDVTDETLQLAQQAVILSNWVSTAALHTLATVYAELGRPSEARDVLLSVVDSRFSDELESEDRYILGRIAEEYGLFDVATGFYRQVEPPTVEPDDETSTFALAQRKLKRLAGTEAPTRPAAPDDD
jgi:transglutaminase-like putative cysteine protease/tetratricopeptide (TPR) repeat protein